MLDLYKDKQDFLASQKVGFIGVGGAGGLSSLLLTLAGVGEIRIADYDKLEVHNLHRQILFTQSNIGQPKVWAAQERLQERNSDCKVVAFEEKIDASNFERFTQGLDLLVDVSDNASSRLTISKLALDHSLDLISGAVSAYTALIAIFSYHDPNFVKKHGCYRCLTNGFPINTKVGITGPIAQNAAAMTAHVALEYLLGNKDHVGKLIKMDLKNIAISKLTLCADPQCPDCSNYRLQAFNKVFLNLPQYFQYQSQYLAKHLPNEKKMAAPWLLLSLAKLGTQRCYQRREQRCYQR